MVLFFITGLYLLLNSILKLDITFYLGIYFITLGSVKGFFSNTLEDVFNLRKTSYIYRNIGLTDTLFSVASILLIFFYQISFMKIDPISTDIIPFLFIYLVLYRFLYWGISLDFRTKKVE